MVGFGALDKLGTTKEDAVNWLLAFEDDLVHDPDGGQLYRQTPRQG